MRKIIFFFLLVFLFSNRIIVAQTKLLGSYTGNSSTTFINGPTTFKNVEGSGLVVSFGILVDSAIGVTYGGQTTNEVTTYTSTYNGNLAGYSGFMDIEADDNSVVTINGTIVGKSTTWNVINKLQIPTGVFINGLNTISIAVTNITGGTGVSWQAELNNTTITKPVAQPISIDTHAGMAYILSTPNLVSLFSSSGGLISLGGVTFSCITPALYTDNSASLSCVVVQQISNSP